MPPSFLSEPLLWAITEHWLCLTLTSHVQTFLNSLQMTESKHQSHISDNSILIIFSPPPFCHSKENRKRGKTMQLYFGARSSRVVVVQWWGREGEGGEGAGEKERELRVIPPPLLCSSPQKNVTVDRALWFSPSPVKICPSVSFERKQSKVC